MTTPTVPEATAAEESVLGACLLLGLTATEPLLAETGLRPEHFHRPSHAAIYTAIAELTDQGIEPDRLTVTSQLRRNGTLTDAGGPVAVEALAAAPPIAHSASHYAADVIEAARWRARLTATFRQQMAINDLDEHEYQAASVAADATEPDRAQTLGPQQLAHRFEALLNGPSNVIPLPWPPLNEGFHGGARPGDTTIVAAHSSHGKSIVGAQWLEHVGDLGGRVALYVNEPAVDDMAARLVAGMTGVTFERIMARRLDDRQRQEIRDAFARMKVSIVPAYGWPWVDVARHLRRSKWDLCALDLFNRLPGRNKTSDVDEAIGGLCNAAAQSGAHLIVEAQLNQERSKGGIRPAPTGRDLRESGSLYNDPANVVFVHQEQDENPETGIVRRLGRGAIYLDKARNGRPGASVAVTLNPGRMRFEWGDEWRGREIVRDIEREAA